MDKNGKYNLQTVREIVRGSEQWTEFVTWQKSRIVERLSRYNKVDTTKQQLVELGEQSPYQVYKINIVSKFLLDALNRLNSNNYGICKYCGADITNERLLLVPAASQCIKCESIHNISNSA